MSNDSKTVGDLNLEDEHITVGVSDTLQEATKAPHCTGGILIVLGDDSKVKGVMGYKQFLIAIDKQIDTTTATCGEYMELDFMEVSNNETLRSALKKIRQRTPQAVVAVDSNGEFSGYFSPSDFKKSKSLVKSLKGVKL